MSRVQELDLNGTGREKMLNQYQGSLSRSMARSCVTVTLTNQRPVFSSRDLPRPIEDSIQVTGLTTFGHKELDVYDYVFCWPSSQHKKQSKTGAKCLHLTLKWPHFIYHLFYQNIAIARSWISWEYISLESLYGEHHQYLLTEPSEVWTLNPLCLFVCLYFVDRQASGRKWI